MLFAVFLAISFELFSAKSVYLNFQADLIKSFRLHLFSSTGYERCPYINLLKSTLTLPLSPPAGRCGAVVAVAADHELGPPTPARRPGRGAGTVDAGRTSVLNLDKDLDNRL